MKTPPPCPEAVNGFHGPANVQGLCPWCGIKVVEKLGRQKPPDIPEWTEVDEAYALHWDPDGWP